MDSQTPEIPTPEVRYSSEKVRSDYKQMAKEVIGVADAIIGESHLPEKQPQGAGLYWRFHGEDSVSAQSLKETAETGNVRGGGIHASFDNWYSEPELGDKYGRGVDASHNLIKDMAGRMGFFDGGVTKKEVERYGVHAKTYEHPTKPFKIELKQNGLLSQGGRRIASFTISHK